MHIHAYTGMHMYRHVYTYVCTRIYIYIHVQVSMFASWRGLCECGRNSELLPSEGWLESSKADIQTRNRGHVHICAKNPSVHSAEADAQLGTTRSHSRPQAGLRPTSLPTTRVGMPDALPTSECRQADEALKQADRCEERMDCKGSEGRSRRRAATGTARAKRGGGLGSEGPSGEEGWVQRSQEATITAKRSKPKRSEAQESKARQGRAKQIKAKKGEAKGKS